MKVLIVGGNSSLAQVLHPTLATFAEVLTAGRSNCNVELDLSWPPGRFDLPAGVDAVVNFAAHFGGQDFEAMLAAEEVNVLGSLKVAHACVRAGVGHLVHISSIFAGLEESSPFYNSYVLSKRHAEELVRLYCRNAGLPLTILRPAQTYGEGESFSRHQPFLYMLLNKAQRGEDIVLYGSNDARRNFIHAEDVAEVIARVVRQRVEGSYVCASLSNVRLSEIAAAAVSAFSSTSTIRYDTDRPDVPDNAFAADEVLYQLIDYYPHITLEQGLTREAERRRGLQ